MQLTSLLTSSHTICWQTQTNRFEHFQGSFLIHTPLFHWRFLWARIFGLKFASRAISTALLQSPQKYSIPGKMVIWKMPEHW